MSTRARTLPLYYTYRLLADAHVWIPVWVVFLTVEQGFSLTEVTGADALWMLAVVLLEVPTGVVADRWGRARSLALGAFSLALALVFFAYIRSFELLLVSFLVWAFATAFTSGADLAWLFDALKEQRKDDRYEFHAGAGNAVSWGGAAIATLIGGPLAKEFGTGFTIWCGVGVSAAAGLAALAMHEPPHRGEDGHEPGFAAIFRQGLRVTWHNRFLRWLLLVSGAIAAGFESVHYVVQPFLLSEGVEVGFLFSALQVPQLFAGAIGSLVAYRLLRLTGETRLIFVLGALGTGAYLGAIVIGTLWAMAFLTLLTVLEGIVLPVVTGAINRRVPSEARATVLSLQSFSGRLIHAPVAPLVGFAVDEGSTRTAFLFLGILMASATALAFITWFGLPARERAMPAAGPGALPAAGDAP